MVALAAWAVFGHIKPSVPWVLVDDGPMSDDPAPVLVVVRLGATAGIVAQDLERAGLIRSASRFRSLAELSGLDSQLKAGRYVLRRTMSLREVLDALASGYARQPDLVTIREGWRAEEVALYLEQEGIAEADAFLEAVAGSSAVIGFPPGATSFEGYLFPDSYEFQPGTREEEVVRRLVGQFNRQVGEEIRSKAHQRGLSVHQLVTLASIIEREALRADELPWISAVYHNRLERGVPLEADPTVQYALVARGTRSAPSGFWKTNLAPADLRMASPYNTYQAIGLPPGPICSPGLASIEAAASPLDGPWMYFVARGDGSHAFAETLEEHLRNVATAQPRR